MTIKVNSSYETATGFLIPRSHTSKEAGANYIIVQILETTVDHFTNHYTTMTLSEIKQALGVQPKERLTII